MKILLFILVLYSNSYALEPTRFTSSDIGLLFPDSQEMLWSPTTGLPSSQYEILIRMETMHWKIMPELLHLMRDTPKCSVNSGLSGTVRDMEGKFFILYSLRPMRAGAPYQFHPNYLWDLPMNIFRKAKSCIPRSQLGELEPLLYPTLTKPTRKTNASKSHILDGLLKPKKLRPPLSPDQCNLLHAAHVAHENNSGVFEAQLNFERSARSPDEQSMFALIFTGQIDPIRSPEEISHLTAETSQFHKQWMDCFNCGLNLPPDLTCVWGAALGHARAHFLRAAKLPQLVMRTVCDGYIGNCPQTGY